MSVSVEGTNWPQAFNRAENESEAWLSSEEGREVKESLLTATSSSSDASSIGMLERGFSLKLDIILCWEESKVNWTSGYSIASVSKFEDEAGLSNILESEPGNAYDRFSFLEISHFRNTEDRWGMTTSWTWEPVLQVRGFSGEGYSTSNSSASTSWK